MGSEAERSLADMVGSSHWLWRTFSYSARCVDLDYSHILLYDTHASCGLRVA